MHDTYLDVRGEAAVVDAVERCWASMWTARAIAYRHTQGFDHATATIAVVVMTMVESDVSGVMFTANPREDRTDEIVINASWGLGEAIVSGIVTPDEFTLDVATLQIKKRVLGGKELQITRAPSGAGTAEDPVSDEKRSRPSLTDDELYALGDLGRRVMAHYDGMPQDIEWALMDGTFYLLQARPVTGADFPVGGVHRDRRAVRPRNRRHRVDTAVVGELLDRWYQPAVLLGASSPLSQVDRVLPRSVRLRRVEGGPLLQVSPRHRLLELQLPEGLR